MRDEIATRIYCALVTGTGRPEDPEELREELLRIAKLAVCMADVLAAVLAKNPAK